MNQTKWDARVATFGVNHYHRMEESSGFPQADPPSSLAPNPHMNGGTASDYEVPGPFPDALGITCNMGVNQGSGHFGYEPPHTWEGWFMCHAYPAADTGAASVILSAANSYIHMDTSGRLKAGKGWQYSGGFFDTSPAGSTVITQDEWYFVQCQRTSGSLFTLHVGQEIPASSAGWTPELTYTAGAGNYQPTAHGLMCNLFLADTAFTWSNVCFYDGIVPPPTEATFQQQIYRSL
jgi:hypothetical protein